MKIEKFIYYGAEALFETLRTMHMRKRPHLKIYQNARISLKENVSTDDIKFAQYYVLEKDLAEVAQCRRALLEFGVDIFKLKGYVRVFSKSEQDGSLQVFDVTPPVVEMSPADGNIPLLNDGMHRVYLAREAGMPINVVMVEGIDEAYPYYAMPNEKGWAGVQRVSTVPDVKKKYRIDDYKSLFRDFNSCFLNVTQTRTSK